MVEERANTDLLSVIRVYHIHHETVYHRLLFVKNFNLLPVRQFLCCTKFLLSAAE
jgi:hypothetical protein